MVTLHLAVCLHVPGLQPNQPLQDHSANALHITRGGYTALYAACDAGQTPLVHFLIAAGALSDRAPRPPDRRPTTDLSPPPRPYPDPAHVYPLIAASCRCWPACRRQRPSISAAPEPCKPNSPVQGPPAYRGSAAGWGGRRIRGRQDGGHCTGMCCAFWTCHCGGDPGGP